MPATKIATPANPREWTPRTCPPAKRPSVNTVVPRSGEPSRTIKPGDLIGFTGERYLGAFINLVTYGIPGWGLSHLGIVGDANDRLLLFEATTTDPDPCEIQGKHVNGSQAHSLSSRLRSHRGAIWHYELFRDLYPHERKRLTAFLHSTLGRPYSEINAFRAGGYGFSLIESMLHPANLHSLFCSEWCAAAHATIGIFATSNVARWSPNLLVRTERYEGILKKPRRLK